ncbi:MAG: glycosyltransferase family 2 protein [Cyanobacteriota bacterium]
MLSPSLGVVTAVRNRREHLSISAALLSRSPRHQRHLIVDWSSEPPLRPSELPADPRISLVRVEGERQWWHSRAYNQAIRHCRTDWILRCDADCLLHPSFFAALQLRPGTIQVVSLPGGLQGECQRESTGLIAAPRSSLLALGGFEPLLVGWGFEDTDLLERLFLAGHAVAALPDVGIEVLSHSDAWRRGDRRGLRRWLPPRLALDASHTANRWMAGWCRERPGRRDLIDPGPGCIAGLPAEAWDQRQRALLAGTLAVLIGRYGRRWAARLPIRLVDAAVRLLQLDPLVVPPASPAAADREPGGSGPSD